MNAFLRYRRETAAAAAAAAIALSVLWAPLSGLGSRPADAGQVTSAAASFADEPAGPQPASAAEPVEAAETAPAPDPTPPAPAAFDGRSLAAGGTAASPSGRYVLTMQDDGNLVLTDGPDPIWATGTSGGPAAMAIGADGNLAVLSAADGSVLWSTGMSGHGPSALGVQDDGNLVLADESGTPVWDRHRGDLTRPVPAPPGASEQPASPRQQQQQPAGQAAGGAADEPAGEPAPPAPADGSFEGRVRAAVASLPGGGSGATFHAYGNPEVSSWGVTDLGGCEVWINPSTPGNRLLDVVRHEYGHVLQCWAYGGDSDSLIADAGGFSSVERIADAIALNLGASWVNYTGSPTDFEWRAAGQIMSGQRIG